MSEVGSARLDGIDKGIAIFLLVSAIAFVVVGAVASVLFWRERRAFEIKQRSAYLVMLTGASFLVVIANILYHQVEDVFGYDKTVFVARTTKYFAIVCSTCCYGSRTIILWLRYNDKYRAIAPWLLRERYHVVVCFLCGVVAMAYPASYFEEHVDNDSSEDAFVERANEQLWFISMLFQAVVIALFPLVWGVDDIFNLRRELFAVAVVLFVQIVVGKAVEGSSLEVSRWVDFENLDFAAAVILFSLSVIHPIKERLLYPMESSEPRGGKALQKHKGRALRQAGMANQTKAFSWVTRPAWSRCSPSGQADNGDTEPVESAAECASAYTTPGEWAYEKVMSTPGISAAFEEFSRKALCHESFLFLEDAIKFKRQFFTANEDGELGVGEGNDGLGREVGAVDGERFTFLAKIVRDYIIDGSPNEINISSRDKKSILEVYKLGEKGFRDLPMEEKRSVFAKAYSEIRFIVESNLMKKFLSTDGFKEACAAGRTMNPSVGMRHY